MPSHSVLPIRQAQPDTTGSVCTGGSHLSHCNIKIILNADRQSCYLSSGAALPSSGIRLTPWSGWTCLSAYPRAAANRANLQPADLSAPKIPSAVPWRGFLQTRSSSCEGPRQALIHQAAGSNLAAMERGGSGCHARNARLLCLSLPSSCWGLSCTERATLWASGTKRAIPLSHLQKATTEQAGTGSVGKTHRTIYLWSTQHPE